MKKLSVLLLSAIALASCQKKDTTPQAQFKIVSDMQNNIFEGHTFSIVNESSNASSYKWCFDHSKAHSSTEETPPDMVYKHCGEKHTITLTATDKRGQSSTFTQEIIVFCSGRHGPGR